MDLPTKSYNIYAGGLFERADSSSTQSSATATDSKGCVVCDSDPQCPTCDDGYQCAITVQSCDACPKMYCKSSGASTSTSSKTNVGGIVGGTLAGVAVLGILLFLFYKYYYQRKVAFNRVRQHKEFFFDDDAEINFHHNRMEDLEKPSQRTSMATTVFTRASNIIPIAYIPGVTIGPQGSSRNGSSSRMSTVSEAGTVSTEFIGDRYSRASIVGNPALTTTAIRAKPKLVTVTEVKPVGGTGSQDAAPGTAVGAQQLGGVRSVQVGGGRGKNQIMLAGDLIEEEEEEEEEDDDDQFSLDDRDDVQSVVMKDEPGTMISTKSDYEPFIIDDDNDLSGEEDDDHDNDDARSTRSRESQGSVFLDVEIDSQSPFDDAFDESLSK